MHSVKDFDEINTDWLTRPVSIAKLSGKLNDLLDWEWLNLIFRG